MDSSKILEDAEECSSSESGWTMYLASPDRVHDGRVDDDDDADDDVIDFEHKKEDGDVDSDDSMASDASSGPSDQKQRLHVHRGGVEKIKKKYNQNEEKKRNHDEQEMEKSRQGANRLSKKM